MRSASWSASTWYPGSRSMQQHDSLTREQHESPGADEVASLRERLLEAEETLRAVRSGEIDAFIVQSPHGERIYSLRSAEQPYRHLVEQMLEGAAILTIDGDIVYCNKRFAELIAVPLEEVVGGTMERFI